ncbi:helix-turn-helix domain-containing protein [Endozoicomonas acroporae]|uniref:helix-turn-helix domain-containing protein n=1 Tax=Endozoicomonas acroporae TaxID=1701104 RepID=UPI000C76653D|nr:helix-turn-helix transcriptional regulator [Endozoicomonas acroporae]
MLKNDNILLSFGETIHKYRGIAGLSQESLAEKAGLDRTYISSVERGQRNVSLLNICKLANALQLPPSELLVNVGRSA